MKLTNRTIKYIIILLCPIPLIPWIVFWHECYLLSHFGEQPGHVWLLFLSGALCLVWGIGWTVLYLAMKKQDRQVRLTWLVRRFVRHDPTGKRALASLAAVELILFLAVALVFGVRTARLARFYRGTFTYKVKEWIDTRSLDMQDFNIFQDGVDGLVAAAMNKSGLPEIDELYIADTCTIRFDEDGTITYLDAFLYGLAGDGKNHTIMLSYDGTASNDMTIRVDGYGTADYAPRMRLTPMLDILSKLDLRQIRDLFYANGNTAPYLLQYSGWQSLASTDGVVLLDKKGEKHYMSLGDYHAGTADELVTSYWDNFYETASIGAYVVSFSGASADGGRAVMNYLDTWDQLDLTEEVNNDSRGADDKNEADAARGAADEAGQDAAGNTAGDAGDQAQETTADQTQAVSAQREIGACITNPVDQSAEFWLDEDHVWRLVVNDADAQTGARFYGLIGSRDGGVTWEAVSGDPFSQKMGVTTGIRFLNREIGFMGLESVDGSSCDIYRTEDGGATWHTVWLHAEEGEGYTSEEFPYMYMPVPGPDGLLSLIAGRNKSYESGAVFMSEDQGKTWYFADIIE